MNKIFLDANILFSAAYNAKNGLLKFWNLPNITLVSSSYALEEARRNLPTEEQRQRLEKLVQSINLVAEIDDRLLSADIILAKKDRPILAAAIAAKCSFLITGDFKDFGLFFNNTIQGVTVLSPSAYFSLYSQSLFPNTKTGKNPA